MNITKVLITIVFVTISSGAYTSCTDHKIFVHAMKQQVDSMYTKEKKRYREYIYI
jgi:phospholipid transport system substrate-binding protein